MNEQQEPAMNQVEKAIEQIEAGEQVIPSNPWANTGLGDLVTWDEVREWLTAL
jgi:hypothetical protein